MNLKKQIITQLQNPNFPDLQFLYSKEVLELAPEILEDLLEEEQQDFQKKLKTKDEDISFEIFEDFSLLDYFFGLLEHYQGVHNDETIRKIIEDFEPKYIDFGNEVAYSKRYYEMLKICFKNRKLNSEQIRILTKNIESYELRWINLSQEKQAELKSISKELSQLSQKFSNNVLDAQKEFQYIIENESIIAEMPKDDREIAKKRAKNKKEEGYLFDASQGSYFSIMKYCSDSTVRKYFFQERQKFGNQGKYDNVPLILKILKLRERKAKLLGFKSYAELSLTFKMAESPEQIRELFREIAEKAKLKGQAELDEMRKYFSLENLELWDVSYYANKLREEKYKLDSKELKKYFQFEKVREGMFKIIQKLYGVEMKKLDRECYHTDVEIYEVSKDGKFLSYFFTDYFYRPLKRQGAWANILREKYSSLVPVSSSWNQLCETGTATHQKKITCNVCNFQKWSDGVTLLTLSDVETMFHEFGHAIHEMLSQSEYSELSWFHVEWDFVELPSQLLENWCRDRIGMRIFAQHFETGEWVPEDMLEKLEKLETFGNGQMVLTQNTYAMMDMDLHSKDIPKTAQDLQKRVEENYELNALLPYGEIYSPHTSFSHIFDGWYAAGYYSYMWAEIIEKEVWKAFKDSWDIFSPEVAQKFHDTILSQGTTKKASELFRDFFWRDVQINAFLREKGLV